jgi:hypothetical protein
MNVLKYLHIFIFLFLIITPVSGYVVGREWNQSDPSTALSTCIDTSRTPIACPVWDNTYPWAGMGRVNTTTTQYQTMIVVPAFWYKSANFTENTFHYMDFWISDTDIAGFNLHPAFTSDSVNYTRFYIGAFEGAATNSTGGYNPGDFSGTNINATTGDKLSSVSGVKPMSGYNVTSATLPVFRILAQNRGVGWGLQNFNQVSAIELMYVVEYGNWNSQSTIGAGVTQISSGTTNMAMPTGLTAGVGANSTNLINTTGQITTVHYSTGQITYPNSYRGVENFYGNIWKWVDGINIKADYMPWIADHDFASNTFAHPYIDTGLTLPSSDGYVSNLAYGAGLGHGFLPSAVAGSSSTRIPDYYYRATGNRVAQFGGGWSNGAYAGAFYWHLAAAASSVDRSIGGRVSYLNPSDIMIQSPTASFTASPVSGTAPLSVQFNDTSTNTPTGWNWSFGDGSFAITQNPLHSYSSNGVYGAYLIASNAYGSNQSANQTITVSDATTPAAAFSTDRFITLIPQPITGTDTSSNTPTSWQWSWGDGTANATTQNPSHSYSRPGFYTINMEACNAGGCSSAPGQWILAFSIIPGL